MIGEPAGNVEARDEPVAYQPQDGASGNRESAEELHHSLDVDNAVADEVAANARPGRPVNGLLATMDSWEVPSVLSEIIERIDVQVEQRTTNGKRFRFDLKGGEIMLHKDLIHLTTAGLDSVPEWETLVNRR